MLQKHVPNKIDNSSNQDLAMYNDLKRQSRVLFDVAEQFTQKNQYNDAIKHYLMAIEADATLVSAYYNIALIYYNTNQIDAAIKNFEKVVELESENACAYNNLGVLYYSKELLQEAEAYFKKTLSLDPNYEEAIQNLEKVHLKQSEFLYTDRCSELMAVVNQNPETSPFHYPNEDHIERAFSKVERYGGNFGGWALAKNAIRSFATQVLKSNPTPHIIELGSGQSTLFWAFFIQTENVNVKISTFEHHPNWGEQIKRAVAHCKAIEIHCYNLRQINDQEWNTIFTFPENAKTSWSRMGTLVTQSEFENTRTRNTFYDIPPQAFPPPASIDGMIVDGPHGNGRSLAFPLFFDCLKPNAWILIDDFDHYPFLYDLARIFKFKIVEKKLTNDGKKWILVRIEGQTRTS